MAARADDAFRHFWSPKRIPSPPLQSSQDAGNIGLVLVVAGLLGSIVCGVLLDATRKYKWVANWKSFVRRREWCRF